MDANTRADFLKQLEQESKQAVTNSGIRMESERLVALTDQRELYEWDGTAWHRAPEAEDLDGAHQYEMLSSLGKLSDEIEH